MSDRQLATIQKIKNIEDILGKDKIGLASFYSTGWKVIVDKTEFHKDDLVIYCEYDSVLPVHPHFEFLRKRCFSEKWNGFIIRAMKMGGVYSEGICFPLSILKDFIPKEIIPKEGNDYTNILGIRKYEVIDEIEEKENSKNHNWFWNLLMKNKFIRNYFYPKTKKGWPSYFPAKTDSTRIQVLTEIFDKFQGLLVYVTEKSDGQSLTVGLDRKWHLDVCSRNVHYKHKTNNNHWEIVLKFNIYQALKNYIKKNKLDFAVIQGEILGPGIQGNKYGLTSKKVKLFNLYIKEKNKEPRYCRFEELETFCNLYNIPIVNLIEYRMFDWKSVEELVEYSKGNSLDYPIPREGVVIRAVDTSIKPIDKMWSGFWDFKVINPDFKIKFGE